MRRQLMTMLLAALALVLVALGAWMLLQSIEQQEQGGEISSHETVLESAISMMKDIKNRNYASLARWAHPVKGVTFTPYSTVKSTDVNLSAEKIRYIATNSFVYNWGTNAGKGDGIQLPIAGYFDCYVYDHDFLSAPEIATNRVLKEGNLPENVKTAYPGAQFVDFYFSGFEQQYEGLDWASLKLVLEDYQGNWTLVGVIHSSWTP